MLPRYNMLASSQIKCPAHKHKLKHGNTVEHCAANGMVGWTCNACKRNSKELQQSHSYRCNQCDFDLCEECTQSLKTSKHQHPMKVTDVTEMYPNGNWGCDNCGTVSSHEGPLPWHCEKGCHFDLCYGCSKDHKSTAHRHTLKKINPQRAYPNLPGWACDICKGEFYHNNPEKPYDCRKCNFDLCGSCMKATAVITEVKVEAVQTKMEKSLTIADGGSKSTSKTVADKPAAMVFISYQWDVQDKVIKLKKKLEASQITCWMDIGNMGGGDDLKKEIDKGIRGCKVMVSCVTKAYSRSQACQQEVALADVLKKPILPVLLESITWPPEGPMSMPFAPLIYISCEKGVNTENLNKIVTTIKSKVQ